MSDLTISGAALLDATTIANGDLLPVLDISATAGSKGSIITKAELMAAVLAYLASQNLSAATVELGAASDTTLARVSAGVASIEGVTIATSSNTLTFTGKSMDAGQLTGTTIPNSLINSNLSKVGTLTGGATGAGFTVDLSTSTITGPLADARLSANVPLLNWANTFTAANINSTAGAASLPAMKFSGVPFAGTGTTSFPLVYLNDSTATASTTLNTNGSYFGINLHGSGEFGRFMKDGVTKTTFSSTGTIIISGGLMQIDPGTITAGNTAGCALRISSTTLSDAGAAANSTRAYSTLNGITGTLAFSAVNANVTITDASAFYIAAPVASTNVTATNLWSLHTAGGVKIEGALSAARILVPFNSGANTGLLFGSTTTDVMMISREVGSVDVIDRQLVNWAALRCGAAVLGSSGQSVTVVNGCTIGTTLSVTGATTLTGTLTSNGATVHGGVSRLKNYTVATLPAGTQGDTVFVTDALAPTFGAAVVGGGAVVIPVFYNGTNWVSF